MASEEQNINIWEEVVESFHQSDAGDQPSSESKEYKFAKKILAVREEAKIASQINEPAQSWKFVRNRIPGRFTFTSVLKYAAILIMAITISSVSTYFIFKRDLSVQYSSIEVPYGQTSKLTLHDGTEVWLNSGTTIKYPNHFKTKRQVFIAGEAFFKVQKDKKKPFIIDTKKLQVKVLGTSFNLSAYEDDETSSLTLIEGKVELNKTNGQLLTEINPGEMATIEERAVRIKNVETSYYSSWVDGKLVFSGVPLAEIARKLERSYNVKIHFENDELADIKFTGTFLKYKPIEQILQAIQIIVPIDYEVKISQDNKNEIRIFGKRKSIGL